MRARDPDSGSAPRLEPEADRTLAHIERAVRLIALWIGGVALFFLVGLTVTDVTLRYIFLAPITGGRDLGSLALLMVVALSIGYSGRTGGQVAVELFTNLLGPGFTRISEPVIRLVGALMLLVLVWRLWLAGESAARFGGASIQLDIPFRPFYVLLAFGIGLYLLVLVGEIVAALRKRGYAANLEG